MLTLCVLSTFLTHDVISFFAWPGLELLAGFSERGFDTNNNIQSQLDWTGPFFAIDGSHSTLEVDCPYMSFEYEMGEKR